MICRPDPILVRLRLLGLVLVATGIGLTGGYGLARTRVGVGIGPLSAVDVTGSSGTSARQAPAQKPNQKPSQKPAATVPRNQDTPGPRDAPTEVPQWGSGQFVPAPGSGPPLGSGATLIRFRVVVESGSGVPPAEFAQFIEQVLADPRGWGAFGTWRFQRVDGALPADQVDFTAHLATPSTTDRICAEHGLDTGGEVSCRGGPDVVINLRRWMLAVPWYSDAVIDYRAMVTNHEIGHFLGFGHETCPGANRLAPVMQTQTSGLEGCARNPWPRPAAS